MFTTHHFVSLTLSGINIISETACVLSVHSKPPGLEQSCELKKKTFNIIKPQKIIISTKSFVLNVYMYQMYTLQNSFFLYM